MRSNTHEEKIKINFEDNISLLSENQKFDLDKI